MNLIKLSIAPLVLVIGSSLALADSPNEIYERRILPLLKSPEANSCRDCHMQGFDLKQFLHADPQQTFVELRGRGWIDVNVPEQSKLLEFISKEPDDATELQKKVRIAEFESMKAWIVAATKDPALLAIPVKKFDDIGFDTVLVRHTRTDQIMERFVIAIWSQFERCANCHSPDRNQKQRDKHGESMSWIVPRSPSKTLEQLITKELIDIHNPEKSLLRTKALGDDSHGGGVKFPRDGETDKAWLAFLHDIAKTRKGDYRTASDLPKPTKPFGWKSGLHLRITEFPQKWNDRLLKLTLHRQQADGTFRDLSSAWAESRVSSERRSWGNSLSLLPFESNSKEIDKQAINPIEISDALPEGVYQARIFLIQSPNESESKVEAKWIGSVEITAPWLTGHSNVKEVTFDSVYWK